MGEADFSPRVAMQGFVRHCLLVDVDIGSKHPPWSRLGGTAVTVGAVIRLGGAARPSRCDGWQGRGYLDRRPQPRATDERALNSVSANAPLIKAADGRIDCDRLLQRSATRCARVVRARLAPTSMGRSESRRRRPAEGD